MQTTPPLSAQGLNTTSNNWKPILTPTFCRYQNTQVKIESVFGLRKANSQCQESRFLLLDGKNERAQSCYRCHWSTCTELCRTSNSLQYVHLACDLIIYLLELKQACANSFQSL